MSEFKVRCRTERFCKHCGAQHIAGGQFHLKNCQHYGGGSC